ncbi:hypothetical protein K505DRAFT_356025 [Melanomma pulvis-pyrius CBS 109.77]|uniref:Uncharacterized protein n=1 Tax=Melanomma pulvis-pyrius CBS 109.77 TaxID=1314802 RepID=A0A6A6XWY7_9PLEO|nr:hypothetical protein K505DRAFT_356025 [Melanomma pulvis-pyrius CBS 109.77]
MEGGPGDAVPRGMGSRQRAAAWTIGSHIRAVGGAEEKAAAPSLAGRGLGRGRPALQSGRSVPLSSPSCRLVGESARDVGMRAQMFHPPLLLAVRGIIAGQTSASAGSPRRLDSSSSPPARACAISHTRKSAWVPVVQNVIKRPQDAKRANPVSARDKQSGRLCPPANNPPHSSDRGSLPLLLLDSLPPASVHDAL